MTGSPRKASQHHMGTHEADDRRQSHKDAPKAGTSELRTAPTPPRHQIPHPI